MLGTVSPATPDERPAACRMLTAPRLGPDRDRAAARYRGLLDSGELDPRGLFVARTESGALRGVMLVQCLPGALGLAWPPRVERCRDRSAIEDALVVAACRWLQDQRVKVCQAFAGELDSDELTPLTRHGFHRVTQVADLHHELDGDPFPPGPLTFDRIDPANRAAFLAVLLASFTGSLDCPEATGDRTDADLLAGYAAPAEHWFLAQHASEPVGVVLHDAGPEADVFELTYLGLIPSVRGRGWGAKLVQFALDHAKKCGTRRLVLSVDVRNEPALRLYRRHGFEASGVREVFLAAWPTIS